MGAATLDGRSIALLRLLALFSLLGVAACAGDARGPFVGTWAPATDTLKTRTTFFADGTARIVRHEPGSEPQTYDARYEVAGDSALTLFDDQGAERFRVRLDDDTLRLQALSGGPEAVWVRL